MRWFVDIGCGSLDKEKIHEPILVIVDPGDAGSHGFEIILFVGLRRILLESNSRLLANIDVTYGNGSFCFCPSLGTGKLGIDCNAECNAGRNNCAPGEPVRQDPEVAYSALSHVRFSLKVAEL